MGKNNTYNQIDKYKKNHEKEIAKLQDKIDILSNENDSLKKRLANNHASVSDAQKEMKTVVFLKSRVKELEHQNKTKHSYADFPINDQKLFSNIFKLKSNNTNADKLIYKFKRGCDDILPLIKKAFFKEKITINDIIAYTFRDNLILLFEKSVVVISNNKPDNNLAFLVKKAKENKQKYLIRNLSQNKTLKFDKKLLDIKLLDQLLMLCRLENTAFHGKHNFNKLQNANKKESVNESQYNTNEFLQLSSEKQYATMMELIRYLYNIFTCEDHEIILLHILSCWMIN